MKQDLYIDQRYSLGAANFTTAKMLPPDGSPPIYEYPGGGGTGTDDTGGSGGGGTPTPTPLPPQTRAYIYTGNIVSSETGEPIPSATVTLFVNNVPVQRILSDRAGSFYVTMQSPAESINISSASYTSFTWPASEYQHTFELEPNKKELDPVVLPPVAKKHNSQWLLIVAAIMVIYETSKKKNGGSVGKVDLGTIVAIAAGGIALVGFDVVKKFLEKLGIWDNPHTKNLDHQAGDPGSPWSPNFWRTGPVGTKLLPVYYMVDMLAQLKSAFGFWDDDEAMAIGVFKKLTTQSQLSFFADWFNTTDEHGNAGGDLLAWLRGSAWPNDRLSDSEVDEINQYILNLPKYMP